jgi:hypothetical protein
MNAPSIKLAEFEALALPKNEGGHQKAAAFLLQGL